MTQATPSSPRPRAKPDSLEKLNQQFAVFREGRPLPIGIHKAIAERLPDLNASQVRIALKVHTGATRYLKAVSQGGARVDLDGEAAGPVTPEQQQQVLNTLKERFRQQATLRKAELAAKEHQQSLQRLAEKFNTR